MSIQILTGDCRTTLATLPEKSVQCCVTSPPYFGLRDYKVAGQIGLEPTPDEYVREMVAVFSAVRRVLKDDGVLWLNLGDSYARQAGDDSTRGTPNVGGHKRAMDAGADRSGMGNNRPPSGFKPKDLLLIPARVAMALQADGWYLRAACPWIKRNGMPDSTQDRPTQCVETMFMLTKSKKCYYDAEAVKVAAKGADRVRNDRFGGNKHDGETTMHSDGSQFTGATKRLRRTSDWFFESWQGLLLDSDDEPSAFVVNLKGYKEAHFATFPPKLVEPCILAATSEKGECPECGRVWERVVEKTNTPDPSYNGSTFTDGKTGARDGGDRTQPGDRFLKVTTGWRPQCQCGTPPVPQIVLDPFGGSGTTAEVARQHGRNAILCELNADYVTLAHKRLGIAEQDQPLILD